MRKWIDFSYIHSHFFLDLYCLFHLNQIHFAIIIIIVISGELYGGREIKMGHSIICAILFKKIEVNLATASFSYKGFSEVFCSFFFPKPERSYDKVLLLFSPWSYEENSNFTICRSSPTEVFLGKDVLKICSKCTGEHP